jgi:archaellum component FlaF (FlaF/FlaG flagellin family)
MVYLILLIGKLVNIHMYYAPTNGNNQIKHANKTYFQQKEINFSTEICPRKWHIH